MCVLDLVLKSPVMAAFIAGAFAVAAVWIGFRRFKSERWWERKAAAYAEIIEALHVLEDIADEQCDALEKLLSLPDLRIEKLRLNEIRARETIRKFANFGGFVITERAAKSLRELTQLFELPQGTAPPIDYIGARGIAAAKALATTKSEAKGDLRT